MSWQPEIDELRRRQELARRMGGPEKVRRQHEGGKLTVRERIDRLLDPDSLREIGSVAGKASYDGEGKLVDFSASNTIVGRGRIDGRMDKESLGGSQIHARNGAVDDEVGSEDEAFERTRKFLSYLPSSVHELPPRGPQDDDPGRRDDWLIEAIPRDRRKVYKARRILESVFDRGSFFEIGRLYGRSVIAGLARLDGWPVAVLGSDPHFYGGAWTADAAVKATRLADLANTFHLPIVQLADIPGFLIGPESEQAATIRRGVTALAAVHQASVPMCSLILRKAFGVAGAVQTNDRKLHYRYAWPSGDWGSLPLEGGIEAAYRAELDQAEDRAALLSEIEARLNKYRSPFRTAEAFLVEEIVDPRDTRPLLCEFANLAAPLRTPGPARFWMRP